MSLIGLYNSFCDAANLNKDGYRMTRKHGKLYGCFMISGTGGHWCDRFVGVDFMGEMVFTRNEQGKRKIAQVIPVRFEGRTVVRGRPVPGGVISMI